MLLKDLIEKLSIVYKHLPEDLKETETVAVGHDEMYVTYIPLSKLTEKEKDILGVEDGEEEDYEDEGCLTLLF